MEIHCMMGDPDLMDEETWKMYQQSLISPKEWDRLKLAGIVQFPEKGKETHSVTDEELLRYLFIDPLYGPRLKKVEYGYEIAHLLRAARADLGDLLDGPEGRELLGLDKK